MSASSPHEPNCSQGEQSPNPAQPLGMHPALIELALVESRASLEELAAALGVSVAMLQAVIAGRTRSLKIELNVAAVLGYAPQELWPNRYPRKGLAGFVLGAQAESIYEGAFGSMRHPRSDSYKLGVRALLSARLDRIDRQCPFIAGTSEADAYWAGFEEGKTLVRLARPGDRA